AWVGIEAGENLFLDRYFVEGDWIVLEVGLGAACRVRTADLVIGYRGGRRTGGGAFVEVEGGRGGGGPVDPGGALLRRPEEAEFWERIVSDPFDATARLVYADWLDEHDDAHAWVFRESMPFAHRHLRLDWVGGTGWVDCGPSDRRRTLWEFAGVT